MIVTVILLCVQNVGCVSAKKENKLFTEIPGQRQTQLIRKTIKYSKQVGYNGGCLYKLNCKDINIEYTVFFQVSFYYGS